MLAPSISLLYAGPMLSVVIEADENAEGLATTLASLIPAAVDGVVREVIVCDAATKDAIAIVADHAGCTYLPRSSARDGIRLARCEWLLLLEPGARLGDGWADALHTLTAADSVAMRFSCAPASRPSWVERWRHGRRPLRDGLVVRKGHALATGHLTSNDIARSTRARRVEGVIFTAPR